MSGRCSRKMLLPGIPSLSVLLRSTLRDGTLSAAAVTTLQFGRRWPRARMKRIADAGLLIGFLDRRDEHHEWAAHIFERESPPFHTAEPILAEVAAVLGSADEVLRMVEVGDLVLSLDLAKEVSAVRGLVLKYKDQ